MSQNAIWETTHEWVDDSIEKMMRFSWDIDNSLSKSMPNNNRRRNAQFDGYRSAFQQQPVREEYSWTDEERALRMRERRLQEKRKTSLCNQYKQSGFCDYGTECRFAHGVHELRMMPEPRNYKTKLCRNYERDQHCSYGDRCQFIHRKKNLTSFLLTVSRFTMSTVESDGAAFDHFIDRVIRRLDTYGHLDGFSDEDLIRILERAQKLLEPQPALIEVRAPVTVFGDLHGQFADLKRFLELVGRPPQTRMLFLGDYVDRCKSSMEVTVLLLCFKIKHPNDIQLLRGNHECAKMNRNYGFYEEVRRKRSVAIWKRFQAVFSELPLCASINRRIFCCHGGISPEIKSWDSLTKLAKPRLNIDCDVGIPLDLMWADPSQDTCAVGWQYNKIRNASWMFGADTIRDFCRLLDIDLIVRAHEATKDGHQFHGDKNQLCTIFSAPNYCGIDGNCASVLRVSEKLEISFLSLRPRLDLTQMTAERRAELHRQAQAMEVKSPLPGGGPHHQTPHFTIQPPIYEQPEPPIISTIAPVDQKTSAQQPSILKVTTPPMSPSSSLTSYTPSTKTD